MTTQPNQTPEEIGRNIVGRCDVGQSDVSPKPDCVCQPCDQVREIAAAIRNAEDRGWSACCMDAERKAPPGHILTDTGEVFALPEGHAAVHEDGKVVVRRLDGELLLTADGVIVGEGSRVYFEDRSRLTEEWFIAEWDVSGAGDHIPVDTFYSTREAAEAARKERGE